ncbi:MAG: hypothetical protein LQ342_008266 [Letrouitia transgressa]|nr:MAG: hypothetical protein LQ342_008266 [Letrouitia transgressa]
MHSTLSLTVSVVAALVGVASGQLMNCCAPLSQALPDKVFAPNNSTYITKNADSWSFTEFFFKPSCVFLPTSTQDLSIAVKLLGKNTCTFAVKGRGHSSLPGAANIDNGVTIHTSHLNKTTIDFEGESVRVGAGNSLGNIYRALGPQNLVAILGRYEKVGLKLALGAGLSFLNNRDGLAVDNVLSYEAVLANGTVINTSRESHPDLHWALKGGSNNFAVVSSYVLRTFKTPYGGFIS